MSQNPTPTSAVTLSDAEIYEITHYKRRKEQLRELKACGIVAELRHDNTIRVLRVDLAARKAANAPEARPRRKSAKQ
jgi:hypothetical protein